MNLLQPVTSDHVTLVQPTTAGDAHDHQGAAHLLRQRQEREHRRRRPDPGVADQGGSGRALPEPLVHPGRVQDHPDQQRDAAPVRRAERRGAGRARDPGHQGDRDAAPSHRPVQGRRQRRRQPGAVDHGVARPGQPAGAVQDRHRAVDVARVHPADRAHLQRRRYRTDLGDDERPRSSTSCSAGRPTPRQRSPAAAW